MKNDIMDLINLLQPSQNSSDILLVIQNIILSVTAVILLWTLNNSRRNLKDRFGIKITQELRYPDWTKRFNKIYNAKKEDLELGGKLQFEAQYTLDKLEWVGTMLRENLFSTNMVMELIGALPLRIWYTLDKVEFVEMRRKERGHYARNAEYFTTKSIEYQIKYKPMEEWTKLGHDIILTDLIKKKLINLKELYKLNFSRQIRAITKDEKLKYGSPFDLYLFCWEEIQVNEKKIKEFLIMNYDLDWAREGKVEKKNVNSIKISNENNYLLLRLEKTKAILEICDDKTDEFIVKIKNGKINIFDDENAIENALKAKDINKKKYIFSKNNMVFGDSINILNPSNLFDTKMILKLNNNIWILKLINNKQILKLCNNKWISKLRKNKWKIIAENKEYIIVKSGDRIYDYNGYENWYREIKSALKKKDTNKIDTNRVR